MAKLFDVVKEIPILDVAKELNIQITKQTGGYAMAVCPFHEDHKGQGGEPNLSIMSGTNHFKCHKCGEKGSGLDMWAKVHKIGSIVEAAKAMAAHWHLAYDDSKPEKAHVKKWKQDKYSFKMWNPEAVEKAHQNLLEEVAKPHLDHFMKIRNVNLDFVKKKKIGLAMCYGIDQDKQFDFAYIIPAFNFDGTVLLSIRLHSRMHRKHKKFVKGTKIEGGSDPTCLYDVKSFDPNAPELWICEGEGDQWTLESFGKNAITTLCGAGALANTLAQDQVVLGDLTKKTRVVLCQDNDNTGLKAMARVRVCMPKDTNVFRVHWPEDYPKKEDTSNWFNQLNKSFAEFEQLLQPYGLGEAEDWLKLEQEKEEAKKKGTLRVYEFGNCYFRVALGKKAEAEKFKKEKKKKKQEEDEDLEEAVMAAEEEEAQKEAEAGEDTRITSFVIHGRATVEIDRQGFTRADLETVDGKVEKNVFLPPQTWANKRNFIEQFPHTKYVIQVSDRDVQDIMQLAVKPIKENQVKKGVKYVGMVDQHFVGPNFIISKDGVVEDGPFEYIPQGNPFDTAVKIFTHDNPKEICQNFCDVVLNVNKPDVILPTLGWMFACFLKEEIHKILHYFPVLTFFGTSGSGKTSLVQTLMRMFGIGAGFRLFSANATRFSVMKMLSSTNCIAVPVDELKENIGRDVVSFWQQRLKNVYFGETETRGNKDQTVSSYAYTAPLLVCGEMSIVREQAIAERTIAIRPERHYIDTNKQAKEAYKRLDKEVPLEALFPSIVQWLLKEGLSKSKEVWLETKLEVAGMKLPHLSSRVWDNFVVVGLGLNMLERFAKSMGVDFHIATELKKRAFGSLTGSLLSVGTRPKIAFDDFLEALAVMAKTGIVKSENGSYLVDGETLYIHLNSCVPPFRKWARDTSFEGEVLGRTELYNQSKEIERMNPTYIVEHSKVKHMGAAGLARCVMINLKKAEEMNLDVTGFGYSGMVETANYQQPAPPPAEAPAAEVDLPPELTEPTSGTVREPGADEEEDMFGDTPAS